jgi:hypothetical protein
MPIWDKNYSKYDRVIALAPDMAIAGAGLGKVKKKP